MPSQTHRKDEYIAMVGGEDAMFAETSRLIEEMETAGTVGTQS